MESCDDGLEIANTTFSAENEYETPGAAGAVIVTDFVAAVETLPVVSIALIAKTVVPDGVLGYVQVSAAVFCFDCPFTKISYSFMSSSVFAAHVKTMPASVTVASNPNGCAGGTDFPSTLYLNCVSEDLRPRLSIART